MHHATKSALHSRHAPRSCAESAQSAPRHSQTAAPAPPPPSRVSPAGADVARRCHVLDRPARSAIRRLDRPPLPPSAGESLVPIVGHDALQAPDASDRADAPTARASGRLATTAGTQSTSQPAARVASALEPEAAPGILPCSRRWGTSRYPPMSSRPGSGAPRRGCLLGDIPHIFGRLLSRIVSERLHPDLLFNLRASSL